MATPGAGVSAITVTFNSAAVLGGLLDSIPTAVEKIVVDNASRDSSREIAAEHGATVIALPRNVGFGGGNNAGARVANGTHLLFINPDSVLAPGAIDALLKADAAYPEAAFNPRIMSGTKRQFRRWSRLLPKERFWHGPLPEADAEIPVLHGACIFIRRATFEAVGGFDEDIFLYHEDDDLGLRLQKAGHPLRSVNGARVEHRGGGSNERTAEVGKLKGYEMGRSLVHVMRKHGRPFNPKLERLKAGLMLAAPHVFLNAGRRGKYLGLFRALGEA